jgi:hypothetical protein
VIDVEGEPNGDAPSGDTRERVGHELGRRLEEVEVVEGEVEARPGGGEEISDLPRDFEGALAAVGQGVDVNRQA